MEGPISYAIPFIIFRAVNEGKALYSIQTVNSRNGESEDSTQQ